MLLAGVATFEQMSATYGGVDGCFGVAVGWEWGFRGGVLVLGGLVVHLKFSAADALIAAKIMRAQLVVGWLVGWLLYSPAGPSLQKASARENAGDIPVAMQPRMIRS